MNTNKSVTLSLVCAAAVALLGCDKPSGTATGDSKESSTTQSSAAANTAPAAAMSPQAAQELFKARCATCHGDSGHGDGPAATALNPKPRNYSDAAWQDKVTDEEIRKTILYGGAAVGKSPIMPGNPDLEGKPELDALVKIVRSFKK